MDPITIALLAAGGGAIVNGAASIFGANKQADAAKAGMREQGRQFDLSRADMLGARGQMLRDLSPYKQAGTGALAQLQQAIMGGEGYQFSPTDPGYQFRLQQGQQAMERAAAAQGGRLSGAQLKAAMNYNQGMASQEFGNHVSRLSHLAAVGQNAATGAGQASMASAGQLASLGANYAGNMGNLHMANANAWANGAQGVANAVNNFGQNALFAAAMGGGGGVTGATSGHAGSLNTAASNGAAQFTKFPSWAG